MLQDGDLLFARTGASVGKSYLHRSQDGQLAYAGFLIRARPDHKKVAPEILAALVSTQRYWDWVQIMSQRSGQPGINSTEYASFPVVIPSQAEQLAMVNVSNDLEERIRNLDALILKKREIKQGVMQQLITGQTRLPGFETDWKVKFLHQGIELLSGHHVLAKYCNTHGIGVPYLTGPADFREGVIRHTKFTAKPTTMCKKNDILITVKGSGSGTMVLADSTYCISRQLMAIRVSDWDAQYVFTSLMNDQALIGAAVTGLIPGLSRGDILQMSLRLPEPKEQTAIAAILSDMDAEIAALEAQRDKVRALKAGMMQVLLTGWIRLA